MRPRRARAQVLGLAAALAGLLITVTSPTTEAAQQVDWQVAPGATTTPASMTAPDVGAPLFTSPTFSFFGPYTCPTGRNKSEPVGEGYIFKVTGRCSDGAQMDGLAAMINDVNFADGEASLDVKVVSGFDRANFVLGFRDQSKDTSISSANYQAMVLPGLGAAELHRSGNNVLANRKDLGGVLSRDDWNTVAIRARGPDFWLMINGQLVIQASDANYDRGHLFFALLRLGNLDDPSETAAVIRNLRVSPLAAGDPTRVPAAQTGQ